MRGCTRAALACFVLAHLAGCSAISFNEHLPTHLLRSSNDQAAASGTSNTGKSELKVANPPARTLRFDGHEIVLGQSEVQALDPDRLVSILEPLIAEQRLQTAATTVLRHRESAERLLAERWASGAHELSVHFVARVLSRRAANSDGDWVSLVESARPQNKTAIHYQNLRNAFAEQLQSSDPSDADAEQLLQASVKASHPLARIDGLRLLGLRELVAGRYAWAESQFRQAIEIAVTSGNPLIASELWLTVAEAARRGNQPNTASTAWSNAVRLHLASTIQDHPLDVNFWILAEKTRPELSTWPKELTLALEPFVQPMGCRSEVESDGEMVLWTAVGNAQLERGQWQSALVNFKKAETLSQGSNVMWLRIAQANCLASMGQTPAASAILSGPATNPDPAIAAAATAAMGSIKLQTGAYQQGAQLLHKAITQSPLSNWPGKSQALADLAIAQLILGDTETGLKALREAQIMLEKTDQREALVLSLSNELRLLEHENRSHECQHIRTRIARLERL